ncbi:MAG: oxidoreductase [Deltaproteobacteria bacterium]|nr:oxidoreductase [Deltaproteobacteria bacterium]
MRNFSLGILAVALILVFPPGTADSLAANREPGEWTNYEGVALGSVNDFYENSIGGVRKVDRQSYRLKVDGLVGKAQSFTYQELKNMPHRKKLVIIHCVEGWKVTVLWEGIPIGEFIKRARVDSKVNTVIFHSADGYTTSLDYKTIAGKDMLLADSANGIVLPAKLGFPLILVAEDKWGYKWARWIERIEFSDKAGFRGYWEQRGFNQRGDASGPEMEERIR